MVESDDLRIAKVKHDLVMRLFAEQDGELETIPSPAWPRLGDLSNFLRGGQCVVMGGPQNVGKSFWVLNVLKLVRDANVKAAYLPLEDDRVEFIKRAFALESNSYAFTNTDKADAHIREKFVSSEEGERILRKYAVCVDENPRTPQVDDAGRTWVPDVPSEWIVDWAAMRMKEGARVLFIDPITQINWGYDRVQPHEDEGNTLRQLLALASDHSATIVLVMHTKKLFGKPEGFLPGIEDLAGSSLWAKLCQTVVMLCAHDDMDSGVIRPSTMPGIKSTTETVTHNRTVKIEKSRYGRGARMMLAYTQSHNAPQFIEHGVIARKSK